MLHSGVNSVSSRAQFAFRLRLYLFVFYASLRHGFSFETRNCYSTTFAQSFSHVIPRTVSIQRRPHGRGKEQRQKTTTTTATQSAKYFATVKIIKISRNRRLSGKCDEELVDNTAGLAGFQLRFVDCKRNPISHSFWRDALCAVRNFQWLNLVCAVIKPVLMFFHRRKKVDRFFLIDYQIGQTRISQFFSLYQTKSI